MFVKKEFCQKNGEFLIYFLAIGIFHFIVCTKYEQKLGLLIAAPMVVELMLLGKAIA